MLRRDKVLVVSRNQRLAQVRRRALEKAGFEVLAAADSQTVRTTCAKHNLRLVVVGHSVLPADKRRVWAEVRQHCDIPVLELHKESGPELMPPGFFHEPAAPDDLLEDVMPVLKRLH
jgi:DNA-binding response OmpR family regulator